MLASEGRAWVSLLSERWYIESVVPRAGFEPAWTEAQRILEWCDVCLFYFRLQIVLQTHMQLSSKLS